jgi:hypothetical protein
MNYPDLPDEFTKSYVEAALFASTDESTSSGGDPLDDNYNCGDIADQSIAKMIADCAVFQERNKAVLALCVKHGVKDAMGEAGYDFWMTRNGHGVGFWDGDWPQTLEDQPISDVLDSSAKSFGDSHLFLEGGDIYTE